MPDLLDAARTQGVPLGRSLADPRVRGRQSVYARYITDWPYNGEDTEVTTSLGSDIVRVVRWRRGGVNPMAPDAPRAYLGEEIYPSLAAALAELARLGGVPLHAGADGADGLFNVWDRGCHIPDRESKHFSLRMITEDKRQNG